MLKALLFIAPLAAMVRAISHGPDFPMNFTYSDYARDFRPSVTLDSPEWRVREPIFRRRLADAIAHNNQVPKPSWWKAINKFSDWTPEELASLTRRSYPTGSLAKVPFDSSDAAAGVSGASNTSSLPRLVDWRKYLTKPRDQGDCGSCWAFAAVETIEAAVAIHSGRPPFQLSVQQMLECTANPRHCGGTGGCEGATEDLGYTYVMNSSGITTEEHFPYTSGAGYDPSRCQWSRARAPVAVRVTGFKKSPRNDREAALKMLAEHGPLSLGACADEWHSYGGGVFDWCNQQRRLSVNHAVQLVGYETTSDGSVEFRIRNSWGEEWGEGGYIRLADTTKCVEDDNPADGSGCDGGPKSVTVCGPCGMFFETALPSAVLADTYQASP
eukprot:TRINITY_DN21595_c0_g1_i1.p2 TRINITY_DN21595_c0_g1~~TRINITY_DN21595_c0_g1_i1.p2  ORF type:complete len:384 (-),score=57.90 TRINITY_DN21595_c0_g1_i1:185-1336(-)